MTTQTVWLCRRCATVFALDSQLAKPMTRDEVRALIRKLDAEAGR